jgi:Zn-dependent peptidase ImmA (M78 family)
MSDRAFVTPKILKWARESARRPIEAAAAKVNIPVERLIEWEEGVSQPTIKQAEILAKFYGRSFALFFLPDIPRDFLPLQDFRRKTSKALSTASIFIIREIQQKQSWISDVFQDNNEAALPFVGKFSTNDNPKLVAKDILTTLEINPGNYKTDNPIKEWIEKAEANGIFISRTSFIHSKLKLDGDEIQGFAIADKYAPFIFVNSGDWEAPQLFTLIHELAHIWIAASGISNEIELPAKYKEPLDPIEVFCNEVAGNVLMPDDIMKHVDNKVFENSSEVFKISKWLGVSSFSFLVRALKLQLISTAKYQILKREAEVNFQIYLQKEEERKAKQKENKGGPNPYLLRLNKNSRLFTQIVLDAFKGGAIDPTQASSLLSTQVNNFPKFEALLYR